MTKEKLLKQVSGACYELVFSEKTLEQCLYRLNNILFFAEKELENEHNNKKEKH